MGHRDHGEPMWTAWDPTMPDFEQRLRNDGRNNTLLETWTSNMVKSDYNKEFYPLIEEGARQIRIPRRFADGTIIPSPYNPLLELQT